VAEWSVHLPSCAVERDTLSG